MNTLQLQYFCELAKSEHLNRTADKLLVSAPALSASIARLEKELGFLLFDRSGRNMKLNEYGEIFLRYAEIALNALESAPREMSDVAKKSIPGFSLGITIPHSWAGIISEFLSSTSGISYTYTLLSLANMANLGDLGNIDIVLAEVEDFAQNEDFWEYVPIPYIEKDEHLCVAMHPDNPLAKKDIITTEELKNVKLYVVKEGYAANRMITRYLESAGISPEIAGSHGYGLETRLYDPQLVRLASSNVRNYGWFRDDVFVDLKEPLSPVFNYAIGWPKNKYHTKTTKMFREYILDRFVEKKQL